MTGKIRMVTSGNADILMPLLPSILDASYTIIVGNPKFYNIVNICHLVMTKRMLLLRIPSILCPKEHY